MKGITLLLAFIPCGAWAAASIGAGASATAGTEGYRSLTLSADADWDGRSVDPYGWTSLSFTRDSRRFSLVGGGAKNLPGRWRVNGGAGFAVGRVYAADASGAGFLMEAGAEKALSRSVKAGAGWSLSAGKLGGPSSALGEDRRRKLNVQSRRTSRGRRAGSDELESETYNELSAFLRLPVSKARLTLRLALGLPSYGSDVVSEMASLRLPVTDSLSATTGLTLEQSDRTRAYISAGVYCLFD